MNKEEIGGILRSFQAAQNLLRVCTGAVATPHIFMVLPRVCD
jgi:hypothetical protein